MVQRTGSSANGPTTSNVIFIFLSILPVYFSTAIVSPRSDQGNRARPAVLEIGRANAVAIAAASELRAASGYSWE